MAEHLPSTHPPPHSADTTTTTTPYGDGPVQILRNIIRQQAPSSTQLLGLLTLIITVGTLTVIADITASASTIGLILFAPLIFLSSPIWLPIVATLFLLVAGFLSLCGFAVAALASASRLYMYFRGLYPPGSYRVDYARSRIADTAGHVKDYAWEYGGFLQSKDKDVTPGAKVGLPLGVSNRVSNMLGWADSP